MHIMILVTLPKDNRFLRAICPLNCTLTRCTIPCGKENPLLPRRTMLWLNILCSG